MKEFAKKFYKSTAWKRCREGYIQSVNRLCERCLKKGKVEPGKILHHTVYLTPDNINDPSISLNWDLLEYVCQDCHNREHHEKYSPTIEGLGFNEYGELIQLK